MCYIASDDREFDTVIKKKATRKLHSHVQSAMPSEAQKNCEKYIAEFYVTQPGGALCRNTTGEDFMRQRRGQLKYRLCKQN